jgi:hypothetical protein
MERMNWHIEITKGGAEIHVSSSKESIFIGEGYTKQEQARSLELANIIVKALNKHENN